MKKKALQIDHADLTKAVADQNKIMSKKTATC